MLYIFDHWQPQVQKVYTMKFSSSGEAKRVEHYILFYYIFSYTSMFALSDVHYLFSQYRFQYHYLQSSRN
jgi:hypothetical protein